MFYVQSTAITVLSCPSESTLGQTCLCLTPLRVYGKARTQMCAHVKDPIAICRKSVGLTDGGTETRTHCTQEKEEAGKRRTMAARFPQGKQPEFQVNCNGTRKLYQLI